MNRFIAILAAGLLSLGASASAMAQTQYMTADHGMRTSHMLGTPIYNDHNDKIGQIDDVVLPSAGGEVSLVLSLDPGIAGGAKLIKVPLSHVHLVSDKMMMPDGTKSALMTMPRYDYAGGGGG